MEEEATTGVPHPVLGHDRVLRADDMEVDHGAHEV